MTALTHQLTVAPVLLPLVVAAAMLLLDERRRRLKAVLSLGTTALLVAVALLMLDLTGGQDLAGAPRIAVYLLSNWPAPFSIVLVVDRLSSIMLVLTSILGLAALVFALARWAQAGPRFHSLFLLQLAGLNGAFLTGDLFNLFVFFEVLLAASYGLALHGSGRPRVKAGLHYIAVNLSSSTLFLIGASLIYGVTGTLNMADLAVRIPSLDPADIGLLHAGVGILGVAFLIKAGMWPLSFWLPAVYSAAGAPVAAVFAVMTKLGVYVILRLWLLMFGPGSGVNAGYGGDWLLYAGMLTVAFGVFGMLSSYSLPRLTSFGVLISSGTVLAAMGTGDLRVIAGALYYLVSSTLAISALFLLAELVERGRSTKAPDTGRPVFSDEYRGSFDDEFEGREVGRVIPGTTSLLGGAFALGVLVLAGLPPLSGFIGKFAIMSGLLARGDTVSPASWALIGIIIVSGFATLLGMLRVGIDAFWAPSDDGPPHVRVIEAVPVVALLALCVALTVGGGRAMRYVNGTAAWLGQPMTYAEKVLSEPPVERGSTP